MINDFVVSNIAGRMRLRSPALHNADGKALETLFSKLPGMEKVVFNPRSGSLLLEYDPDLLTTEKIMESAATIDLETVKTAPPEISQMATNLWKRVTKRRFLNRTMYAALLTSVGAIMLKYKGVHAGAGAVFFLINCWHVYVNRKPLFK